MEQTPNLPLIFLLIAFIVFMAARELVTWYLKQNQIVKLLEEMTEICDRQTDLLTHQNTLLTKLLAPKKVKKSE